MEQQRSASEILRRYYKAWAAQDRHTVEQLTAQDFHFTSPLDNRLDRKTFLERCWPNSKTTASIDLKRVAEDGDVVLVTYELTTTDGRRFRNTEAITVRNGQLHEAEVYFGWDLPHKAALGSFIQERN